VVLASASSILQENWGISLGSCFIWVYWRFNVAAYQVSTIISYRLC
jgi:hypothetical protein